MAHHQHQHAAGAGARIDPHDLGHVVPFSIYASVLATLLVLTIVTVAISRVDFGNMNLVVAMVIASVKAGIVALFFMHLKYENPLVWLYVAFPLLLVGVMMGGIFVDNPTRAYPSITPPQEMMNPAGKAPAVTVKKPAAH